MTTTPLTLAPRRDNNPNPSRRSKPVMPPTLTECSQAVYDFLRITGIRIDAGDLFAFAVGSVATARSVVTLAKFAKRCQLAAKVNNPTTRAKQMKDYEDSLYALRQEDLKSADLPENAERNLKMRGLPSGKDLRVNQAQAEILKDWGIYLFNAPKAGALFTQDAPKVVADNARLVDWILRNANKGARLERYESQMKAAQWGLLETIDAIFNADTETLQGLVNAEESRREEARAERDAATATAEIESVPAAEAPSEGADVNEVDEVEAVAS